MVKQVYLLILLLTYVNLSAKNNLSFKFETKNRKYQRIYFQLINYTPVIPLKINNSDTLYFIVDTGLSTTLISRLFPEDSVSLNYSKESILKGLGIGVEIKSIQSYSNQIKIGKLNLYNIPINVMKEDIFNLSSIYGTKINGIIGYSLFKDFIVKINYSKKYIEIYDPKYFRYKKKKKRRSQLPFTFYNKKPYIQTYIVRSDNVKVPLKLLIDSGASLAFWLSLNTNNQIKLPGKNIPSLIGQGLSGKIYGKIGRINELHIGKYKFNEVITAFPDSISVKWMLKNEDRNGSIGGEILSKFNVIIDYTNQMISFSPNAYFKKEFYFNHSGIELRKPYLNLPIFKVHLVNEKSPA